MTEASKLKNYYYRLYLTFLDKHMKSTSLIPSSEEEDSVKAFCVLAHAALEEFFEKISLGTVRNAYLKYKSKKPVTKLPTNQDELDTLNLGILQLIETLVLATNYAIFSGNKSDILKQHKTKLEQVGDLFKTGSPVTLADLSQLTIKSDHYAKELMKEASDFFYGMIKDNHGASLKYLLKILIPVGIDIPNDLSLNSLQKLAEYRGDYAHTSGISKILSVTDIVKYSKDVIALCVTIEKSVDDFVSI